MKVISKFLLILTFISGFCGSVYSEANISNQRTKSANRLVNPLYELRVSDITLTGASPIGLNIIEFDISVLHTNLPESGPFEFSQGQYYFNFNPAVANGGTLTYSMIPGTSEFSNPDAIPRMPNIEGNQLRLELNDSIGAGNGPIVSSVFPGTRVIRMKLETTAPLIDFFKFNLEWRDSTFGDKYTKVFAFVDGVSTNITSGGTLIIDTSKTPLPVELTSFASSVYKNNVTLNWSTSSEINNSGFDIERSGVSGQWSKITFVNGNGTTYNQNSYSFNDENLNSGKYFYRLKQKDFNGEFEYFYLRNEVIINNPSEFVLHQNFPNPFNPVTNIEFEIPEDSYVRLELFNSEGRKFKTILNEFRLSGYYKIVLNASDLTSGVYFYKLITNLNSSTKKMVLLK